MDLSRVYTDEERAETDAKIEALKKEWAQHPLATVVPDRPDDATTRILRAWLAFLETLYQHGVNAEYIINNVEVARVFAVDLDTFKKLLNPLGMRGTHYTSQDRLVFVGKAKMLAENLLLAHETQVMHQRPSVFATKPMHEKAWDIPSKGYISGSVQEQFSHGYNTYHDAKMRGEIVDET